MEGLIQISDGSLDDVNISDIVQRVNPEKLYLDIKKELPKESKLITHYFNKETNIETNTNPESSVVNQLETKEELHNALHIQGQE